MLKASIAMQKGDFPEALRSLDIVLETDPEEIQLQLMLAQSYRLLSRVYRALGETGKAVACEVQARATLAREQEQRTAQLANLREELAARAAVRATVKPGLHRKRS